MRKGKAGRVLRRAFRFHGLRKRSSLTAGDVSISGKFAAGRDINIRSLSVKSQEGPSPGKLSKVRRKLLRKTLPAWLEEDRRLFLPETPFSLQFPVIATYGIDRVSHPRASALSIVGNRDVELFDENSILVAHKRAFGHLLVLGEAGSGKTHLIHQVMNQMLAEASSDTDEPIPFYLSLSRWDGDSDSMWDWCVSEIAATYSVGRSFLEGWRERGGMALLLDGLDDLRLKDRRQCVSEINSMLSDWVGMPVIVACRTREYGEIGKRLRLRGSLEIDPISSKGVLDIIQALGSGHAGLMKAVVVDRSLRSLLQSPLFLALAISTYEGSDHEEVPKGKNARESLIERYLEISRSRSGLSRSDFGRDTWLPYIAASMRSRREIDFQPDRAPVLFLPQSLKRTVEKKVKRRVLMAEIIPSVLIRASVTALAPDSQAQIVYAILTVVFPAATSWIAIRFAVSDLWVTPTARVTPVRKLAFGYIYRLTLVLVVEGAIATLLSNFVPSWKIVISLAVLVFPCGAIWPTIFLMRGSQPSGVDHYPSRPGGELRSLAGTVGAVAAMVGIGLYVGLTISFKSLSPALLPGMLLDPLLNAIFFLPPLMVLAGLRNGGSDLIRRVTCIQVMADYGILPERYFRSLELVRKSSLFVPRGGSLEFRHSLIRDYLAEFHRKTPSLGDHVALGLQSVAK
ncbi:NACHT domain-containing protein [Kitasatospora purpeofusca]|uniref:NACHT domain-containing protein n=1 Tax=Kitasatospora purpeofusca TaxID=67352 RepID=UPI0036CE3EAB